MVPLLNPAFLRLSDGAVLGEAGPGEPADAPAAHAAADPQAGRASTRARCR